MRRSSATVRQIQSTPATMQNPATTANHAASSPGISEQSRRPTTAVPIPHRIRMPARHNPGGPLSRIAGAYHASSMTPTGLRSSHATPFRSISARSLASAPRSICSTRCRVTPSTAPTSAMVMPPSSARSRTHCPPGSQWRHGCQGQGRGPSTQSPRERGAVVNRSPCRPSAPGLVPGLPARPRVARAVAP